METLIYTMSDFEQTDIVDVLHSIALEIKERRRSGQTFAVINLYYNLEDEVDDLFPDMWKHWDYSFSSLYILTIGWEGSYLQIKNY